MPSKIFAVDPENSRVFKAMLRPPVTVVTPESVYPAQGYSHVQVSAVSASGF